jgi:hypothetical protein
MKIEVKRVGLFSTVKTLFVLGGVAGFMFGVVEWMFLAMIASVGESLPGGLSGFDQAGMMDMLGAGIGALGIMLPLVGGFAGAVAGVFFGGILTGIYNIAARLWGGLEVDWTEVTETTSAPVLRPSYPGQATPLPTMGTGSPTPETSRDTDRRPPAMYE